ncbi:MAG: carboxypeptidase-like regulatory domain-containing protein [Bacteroidales bacterium]|nr:carboxypeptidase-like regulatory domain-containing protein [Bacteroidales bacterium]
MAQNIEGRVISENGDAIPFASIFLKNKNIGIISDIEGKYRLPSSFLLEVTDTIIFSSVGYTTRSIPIIVFKEKLSAGDTNVVMLINSVSLPEVTITSNANLSNEYGMFHLQRANFSVSSPSLRVMVFVKNTDSIPKIIQSVNIRTIGVSASEVEKLRVFFYQQTENGFQNIHIPSGPIFITDFTQQDIRHDVSEHRIPFPAEGIYVGIESIGKENIVQDMDERRGLRLSGTDRAGQSYSWIFVNEEWEQFPPPREIIAEAMKDVPIRHRWWVRRLLRNMNFQIGITAH